METEARELQYDTLIITRIFVNLQQVSQIGAILLEGPSKYFRLGNLLILVDSDKKE